MDTDNPTNKKFVLGVPMYVQDSDNLLQEYYHTKPGVYTFSTHLTLKYVLSVCPLVVCYNSVFRIHLTSYYRKRIERHKNIRNIMYREIHGNFKKR